MSRLSDVLVDVVLEEILDYEFVNLSLGQLLEVQEYVDGYEDKDSVEIVINRKLIDFGYIWSDTMYKWLK